MRLRTGLSVLAAAAAIFASQEARADLSFDLTQDFSSGGFGEPAGFVFATVLLHQNGADTVDVTVTLASGYKFVGAGSGFSLGWDLAGNPAITITGLPSGFEQVTDPP